MNPDLIVFGIIIALALWGGIVMFLNA
ncbi:hypothetical protein SEA_CINDARADIX_61 [Mycobacterium phage Cindaradix]|uniref:Uncharacterized protein n=1 Tax=Mycobacterium phage Cindaradix TaxID=2041524 RepID=A0A2D1G918_9CAUD|nr:hypothetical protein KIY78_gp61 [Mycobacterium phage Cindaradix]APM00098.1 hypothetical protein SEA_KRATARK_64 [Mycobacterium phage Kratark]ATN88134.1 hypothetical protein SEA_CINDARADIX_61 [Mycobacterium phage Cindaradix]